MFPGEKSCVKIRNRLEILLSVINQKRKKNNKTLQPFESNAKNTHN